MQAQEAARLRGLDAALFLFAERLVREGRHAVDGHARAVEGRADLRGAIEAAAQGEELSGGAARTHVGLHRVRAVRVPFAHQLVGAEEMQLVVDLGAVGRDIGEHPPAVVGAMQRRVRGADAVHEDALALPLVGEVDAAVDLDGVVVRGLRDHVELALVLDEEGIGEVVVALEDAHRL